MKIRDKWNGRIYTVTPAVYRICRQRLTNMQRITERPEREIIKQQELDKRILEQNIELSMKVKLGGDD